MAHRGRSSSRSSGGEAVGPSQGSQRPVVHLVPINNGFDLQPSKIVLDVSKAAYRCRLDACWPRWENIPSVVVEVIWQDVLAEIDIQADDMDLAKLYWVKKMRKNYKDSIYDVKKAGKKPQWMGESVYRDFLTYWETDEAKAESDRNSANRNKNPVIHRGGSKSFQQYRQELEAENEGPVGYMDVFTRTHVVEHVNPDGTLSYTWQDDKSVKTHAKFMEHRQKFLAETGRDQLTTEEEDAIFQAVMDPPAHGRRYGFGNQASSSQTRSRKSKDREENERLRARMNQLEEQLQEQNRRQAIETTQLIDQRIAEYMQQFGGRFQSSAASGDGEDD